ncbi:MAG: hypothetical protein HQL32_18110 [Planctomycetes bacterium]|nr:hypothetical protein [Planctomycetota bacterium]
MALLSLSELMHNVQQGYARRLIRATIVVDELNNEADDAGNSDDSEDDGQGLAADAV